MRTSDRTLWHQQPKLIERYIRRAAYRKTLALARRISRPRLQWSERERRTALVQAFNTIAEQAARSRRSGFEACTTVLNLSLFLLLAERDIQSVKVDALTHPDPWKRSICSRLVLLTIHELDLDKVAGKSLRQAFEDAKVPKPLRQEVADALEAVRGAQDRARKRFSSLRNSTIAHRDANALQQFRDIAELDGVEVLKDAAHFYEGIDKFMHVLPKLLMYVGTPPSLIQQISAQSRRRKRFISM